MQLHRDRPELRTALRAIVMLDRIDRSIEHHTAWIELGAWCMKHKERSATGDKEQDAAANIHSNNDFRFSKL